MAARFTFQCIDSLPRLAWCARVPAEGGEIRVVHGPWVETREDVFFDGAWDGPFDDARPDQAVTFTGSGGRVVGDQAIFATSTAPTQRIYLKRTEHALWLSNSHVFLMVHTGDGPDPAYPYYAEDVLLHGLAGIWRKQRTLRTHQGAIVLHECANLVVTPELQVRREEKTPFPPPRDFEEYVAMLDGTVGRVMENAADSGRIHTYQPLVALSRGYDSPSVAALARNHGCNEAFTFAERVPGVHEPAHDATEIGRQLGMNVTRHAMLGFKGFEDAPEASFCMVPPGEMVMYASVERRLEGMLLLTGDFGDRIWSMNRGDCAPDIQCDGTNSTLGGHSLQEYRLRVGFQRFDPAYLARQHGAAIHAISTSDALKPWSVGGDYDRPISRRLREEAGLPSHLFLDRKSGGFVSSMRTPDDLSDHSRRNFQAFVRELAPPRRVRLRLWLMHAIFTRLQRMSRAAKGRKRQWQAEKGPAIQSGDRLQVVPRFFRLGLHRLLAHPEGAFLFQWGFERTRGHYQVGDNVSSSSAPS